MASFEVTLYGQFWVTPEEILVRCKADSQIDIRLAIEKAPQV